MLAHTTRRDFSHSEVHLGTVILGCLMRKKILIVFSGILAVLVAFGIYASMQVHASPDEQARPLAGDDLIAQPLGSVNHAITIRRPPRDVWPWLAQMGSGRAGWYAYDFIDNRGHRSAEHILPEYQNVGVASIFPALPGATDVFIVAQCVPEMEGQNFSWQELLRPTIPESADLPRRGGNDPRQSRGSALAFATAFS